MINKFIKAKKIIIFILFPVFLTTFGEFILKSTINTYDSNHKDQKIIVYNNFLCRAPRIHAALPDRLLAVSLESLALMSHPKIALAVSCIFLGGLLWLLAMSKFELSFLYPFLSINYLAIIVGSQLMLGEDVSIFRYFSVFFIIIGLVLISRSPYSEDKKE
ncbi:hypothetical protein ACFL96_08100 [Thermoproteota archaeon]